MLTYKGYSQNKLGNYPVANVVFSVMLALFVVGLFGLLILHAAQISREIKENVKIQVYLNRNISEIDSVRISQVLAKKSFVLKRCGVAQITYISREEAAKSFIKETGDDFLKILEENPMRDSYVVNINQTCHDRTKLQIIKKEIESIHGVFEVDYVEGFIDSMNDNFTKIGIVLASFALFLLIAVIFLINNTIKLAIYSQRFLIRSMELVGATPWFIKKPFLTRAVLIGLISGAIADSLLLMLLHYANRQIEYMTKLQTPTLVFGLLGLILLLGVFISFIGTYKAVGKYLAMSLDDLH